LLLAGALLGAPAVAAAWPAVQDATGTVYVCESRPVAVAAGHWSCHSLGGPRAGILVEVAGPGGPPGARSWRPYGPPSRWGPPPREPSGYDALDPWLPPGGVSDR
jgi:hypothetical protein